MQTPYDWVTVAIFLGVAWLFLRRMATDAVTDEGLLHYLPPAIGCAIGNHLGNHGHDAVAIVLIGCVLAYCWIVLKPFGDGT